MAIAVIAEIPGGTREQYDRINAAMNPEGAAERPPGEIIHFAGPAEDGWIVVDVWESREAYEAHVAERREQAREAVREAGLPPYTHREIELYNLVK